MEGGREGWRKGWREGGRGEREGGGHSPDVRRGMEGWGIGNAGKGSPWRWGWCVEGGREGERGRGEDNKDITLNDII